MNIDFWYEFASPYAYIAAMRIEDLAREAGAEVRWRPVIIGPIFHKLGHKHSPYVDVQAKNDYIWVDAPRRAAYRGVPYAPPPGTIPRPSTLGARVALFLERSGGDCPGFSKGLYRAAFAENRDPGSPETVAGVLTAMGLDAEEVIAAALTPENKQALFDQVAEAEALGIFGIPTFVVDGELYWGEDRLDQIFDR